MIRYDTTEGGGRRLKNWFDLLYLSRPSAAEVMTISQLHSRKGRKEYYTLYKDVSSTTHDTGLMFTTQIRS